jgi:hypothetical protein
MAGLAARDSAVRALVRSPANGRSTALAGDLWRLAALRRTVRAGHLHTDATVEEGGRRLVLTSRPGPAPAARRRLTPDVAAALENGTLAELIWDHGAVGEAIPLLGDGLLPASVGHRGVAGAHAFSALVELARREPRAVLDALDPLLSDGGEPRPA